MRLAAIDLGSNAIRLLICEVGLYTDGSLDITKLNLIRVPLRLGFDVFENKRISDQKKADLIETMKSYKHLLKVYNVQRFRACATSAMRDAENAQDIIDQVKQETGITIEVITGNEEARIIYETHLAETLNASGNYLYIDVGGGSTELSYYSKGKLLQNQSFNIGTIRMLKNKDESETWDAVRDFLKAQVKSNGKCLAIGSGGNINKLFSMSKRKNGKPLDIDFLKSMYKEMNAMTVSERIHQYGFKEDRADVIVPALQVYIQVMTWGGIKEIHVPQIGLADGLIHKLYEESSFSSLIGLNRS
ncbi:MAG: exopolyphosphatase [Chitinophagaceae bacterium]|nr:exopolyphosphatase [Chitinophagaceae bacterium]